MPQRPPTLAPGAAAQDERWRSVDAASQCDGWDMPLTEYLLSSGKRKRRACGVELNAIMHEVLASPAAAQALRDGRFHVVVERPSPMPATDGWQSSSVAGAARCDASAVGWPMESKIRTRRALDPSFSSSIGSNDIEQSFASLSMPSQYQRTRHCIEYALRCRLHVWAGHGRSRDARHPAGRGARGAVEVADGAARPLQGPQPRGRERVLSVAKRVFPVRLPAPSHPHLI